MKDMHARRIGVIGATGAIGASILRDLREAGASPVAFARSAEKLAALGDAAAESCVFDLRRPEGWDAAVDELAPLDGLVFATGKLEVLPFSLLTAEKFTDTLSANVVEPAAFLRCLLRAKKINSGASIVLIGSISGIRGTPGHAAYAASKSALHGLVRTLALELAPRRIRVNMLSPGLIDAGVGAGFRSHVSPDQFASYVGSYPLGAGGTADVAGAALFLLSSGSRWVTGHDLVVDGGASLR